MDNDSYDSIQLISVTEVIEEYYQLMKQMFQNAVTFNKNKKNFDSFLCPDDELTKTEFVSKAVLLPVSEALVDLVVCLEWQNNGPQTLLPHKVVYDTLLRLENALKNSSTWEILCSEDYESQESHDNHSGPGNIVSEFEINLLEKCVPAYVNLILDENKEEILFFPLTNQPQENVTEKWRILEKFATMKISSQKMTYKEKLSDSLKEKLQAETSAWIDSELQKVKLAGKNSVLTDMQELRSLLQNLADHVVVAADVIGADGLLFSASQCSYFDTIAAVLDNKLYPAIEKTMENLDLYHNSHKNFHVNIRESSAICHSFYSALKNLVQQIVEHVKGQSSFEKMKGFHTLFGDAFLHLLHVLKSECHFRVSRAVLPGNKDDVHEGSKILMSSVMVLNCLCTVLDEMQNLEIEDGELRIAFLVKVADTICDGAKIYAEALDQRAATMNAQSKDPNYIEKLCVIANSIEHVRSYLLPLPELMKWEEVLPVTEDTENTPTLRQQILQLLSHIQESMDNHLKSAISRIEHIMVNNLRSFCEKFINPWLQNVSSCQNVEKLVSALQDHLCTIHDMLEESIFNQFLRDLWLSFLGYIKNKFQEGQRADYARNIKQNVEDLHGYFLHLEMKESEETRQHLRLVLSSLDLNSKTTVELQLDYYGQLADLLISPLEYLGHLAFQAGYKTSQRGTVDIFVKVQKGQRIPVRKFDIDELTVTVELCPNSIFPAQHPVKTEPVLEQLDNPVFYQTFEFLQLHASVLTINGAVIQLLVQNQDSSFSAEAVLNLNLVQNMNNIVSMDFLPVYLMPLRMFDRSQPSFKVLESRSKWDRRAKSFVSKRLKVTKNRRMFKSCIPGRSYSICGVFGSK